MAKYSAKLSGLNRVNWDNKTEKQKANYFKKAYTDLGLNIPKYILNGKMSEKQLQSSINKLTRSLQSRAKKEQNRLRKQRSNKSKSNKIFDFATKENVKTLKEFNKFRNKMGDLSELERYLGGVNGEYITLSGVYQFLREFDHIKGNIKLEDLSDISKNSGFSVDELFNVMKNKIRKFDLNRFSDTLKYYGFTEKEVKDFAKEFNKANYKRQDNFLKILNNFVKGKDKYKTNDDDIDHTIAKENFRQEFELRIIRGFTSRGESIDEL